MSKKTYSIPDSLAALHHAQAMWNKHGFGLIDKANKGEVPTGDAPEKLSWPTPVSEPTPENTPSPEPPSKLTAVAKHEVHRAVQAQVEGEPDQWVTGYVGQASDRRAVYTKLRELIDRRKITDWPYDGWVDVVFEYLQNTCLTHNERADVQYLVTSPARLLLYCDTIAGFHCLGMDLHDAHPIARSMLPPPCHQVPVPDLEGCKSLSHIVLFADLDSEEDELLIEMVTGQK